MPSAIKPFTVKQLQLGLFTDANPFDIPAGGCAACNNVVWVDGYLRIRPGIQEAYTTLSNTPAIHLSRFIDNNGDISLFRFAEREGNIDIYRHDGATWSTTALEVASADPSSPPCSASWKNKFWYTTGGGEAWVYDPIVNDVSKIADLQSNAAYKIPYNPRLLIAGPARLVIADCFDTVDNSGDRIPWRLAWSDMLDGTTWNSNEGGGSSGYVDLVDGDNDPITALYASGSTLLVFKPNSIYIGVPAGPPKTFDFKERIPGVGCVSHKTLKKYREGWIYWLGDDNVYKGGVDRSAEPVGDRIVPRLRQIASLTDMSKARATIDRINHLYHLFIPDGGEFAGRVIWIFTLNLKTESWFEGKFVLPDNDLVADQGFGVGDAIEFRPNSWSQRSLIASTNGKIYEMSLNFLDDNGKNIPASWVSGMLAMPEITAGKLEQASVQSLRAFGNTGRVRLGVYSGDNMDRMTFTDFGEQVMNGSDDVLKTSRPYAAENFQIQISYDDSADAAPIAKLTVSGVPMEGPTRR